MISLAQEAMTTEVQDAVTVKIKEAKSNELGRSVNRDTVHQATASERTGRTGEG